MPLSRPVSGPEAAKLARLSQTRALRALDDLVALGVLRRTETPSQHLFEMNRTHQRVQEGLEPAFRAERERIGRVLDVLRSVLEHAASAIALAAGFGSAARGEDDTGSDFDVLVVARTVTRMWSGLTVGWDAIPRLEEEFGLDLSPVVLPLARFQEMHRSGDPLASDVLRDGRVIMGKRPDALCMIKRSRSKRVDPAQALQTGRPRWKHSSSGLAGYGKRYSTPT